ncbi:MAG: DUF1080 domain-containing protein [Pirellulaceae bacterium]
MRAITRFAFCIPLMFVACLAPLSAEETEAKKQEQQPAAAEEKTPPKLPHKLFDGKSLKGWKVLDKTLFAEHGEVKVVDGEIQMADGQPATGLLCTTPIPKSNYEIRLEAKRTGGNDFFCGLTFPIQEGFATLIIGGWGGGVTGVSNVDGYAAVENPTTGYTEFENDKWYKIKLRVTDKKLLAWIDDEVIVELTTDDRKFEVWWEQEMTRPLGITTWYTSNALRNIEIHPVD